MKALSGVATLVLAAAISGCAVTAADRAPRTDPVARLAPAGASPWTVDLGDPVLADLLRRADAGAFDVKAALARLERAQADVEEAKAARRLHLNFGSVAVSGGRSSSDTRTASSASEANYEIDLWGRRSAQLDSATFELTAADADVTTARLLVAAEIVRSYAALRASQAAMASAEAERGDAGRSLSLVAMRRAEGVATGETLEASREAKLEADALATTAREDADLQAGLLADMVGAGGLSVPPGEPLAVVPWVGEVSSDVVDGRPDVRAALARLKAADADRAGAIAASRPQFLISALFGAPGGSVSSLLDGRSLAWAVASSVSRQVFEGRANRARIHAAGADADAADIAYRKTVMTAWQEVRTALVEQARAGRASAMAESAVARAKHAVNLGRLRHQEGLADALTLSALGRDEAAAAAQARGARLQAVEARVRLALATGGR